MGIWIRSQDREILVNCKKFEIVEKNDGCEIFANYKYLNGEETYDVLGEYSTKEKSLKVLDTIVKQMELCAETRICKKTYSKQTDWDTYEMIAVVVFQMPADDEV